MKTPVYIATGGFTTVGTSAYEYEYNLKTKRFLYVRKIEHIAKSKANDLIIAKIMGLSENSIKFPDGSGPHHGVVAGQIYRWTISKNGNFDITKITETKDQSIKDEIKQWIDKTSNRTTKEYEEMKKVGIKKHQEFMKPFKEKLARQRAARAKEKQ